MIIDERVAQQERVEDLKLLPVQFGDKIIII